MNAGIQATRAKCGQYEPVVLILADKAVALLAQGGNETVLSFQLPHGSLFPGGTRLFSKGDSGEERLVLETGKQVTLELVGVTGSSAAPAVSSIPVPGTSGKVSLSPLAGTGAKRRFTIKGDHAGKVTLEAGGASLLVDVGSFKNDPEFDIDLIANVFRGSDPAKMHVLARTLFSNDDNLFNESSDFNKTRFKSELPCGSVCKAGGSVIFHPIDYDYKPYSKPVPHMGTDAARSALKHSDIKYDVGTLKRGCAAIKKRLERGIPSIVGIVLSPSSAVRAGGIFNETGDGGHSILVVGCDAKASLFLCIDVFPKGSKKTYKGGHGGTFPDECSFLGVLELVNDAARGSFVLRSREENRNEFSGESFEEVVSGPL